MNLLASIAGFYFFRCVLLFHLIPISHEVLRRYFSMDWRRPLKIELVTLYSIEGFSHSLFFSNFSRFADFVFTQVLYHSCGLANSLRRKRLGSYKSNIEVESSGGGFAVDCNRVTSCILSVGVSLSFFLFFYFDLKGSVIEFPPLK